MHLGPEKSLLLVCMRTHFDIFPITFLYLENSAVHKKNLIKNFSEEYKQIFSVSPYIVILQETLQ